MIARRALLTATLIFAACSDDVTDPPGTAFISGVVQDTDGSPLAGAVIRANAAGRSRQTVAAADGTFMFSGLTPGPWQLIVDGSEDYQAGSIIVQVVADRTTTVTMVVDLRGVIRGVVRYNDTDQPAAGVQVRLVGNGVDRNTTTSADGSYTFRRVAAGMLSIEVQPVPSYRGETRLFSFDGTVLTLAGTLARVSGAVTGMVRSWNGGDGVGGVSVHLSLANEGPQYVTVTDADGVFNFPEVALGTQTLTIVATPEYWAPTLVASLQGASLTTSDMWLLPRSTLRPIAFALCIEWDYWHDNCILSGISVINSDGTGARAVVDDFAGSIADLSWSPDGSKLVFSAWSCGNTEGCRARLHVINADGTGLVDLEIFPGNLDMHYPAWSPDGGRILFTGEYLTQRQLYFLDTDDNSISEVPNTRGGWGGSWSPDGGRIAFLGTHENGPGTLYVVNADGTSPVQLPARGSSPAWSRDGRRIAFQTYDDDSGHGRVSIIDVADLSVTDVAPGHCPSWSPDGSLIALRGSGGLEFRNANGDLAGIVGLQLPCPYVWSPLSL